MNLKEMFNFFGPGKNDMFSINVRPVTRRDRSLVIFMSSVTHLFDDMTPPIEGHMREKHMKNNVGPNDHKRFQENQD